MYVLRLIRPVNVAMIFAGAVVGAVLVVGPDVLEPTIATRVLIAAFSAAAIGAGGNALNDWFDIAVDRVNQPHRPLASGAVRPVIAAILWVLGSLAGITAAFAISTTHAGIAFGAAALLFVYNAYLKRIALGGNLAISILVATVLVYGGLAVGWHSALAVAAGFAFVTTLARELVKDCEDVVGDRRTGARTLPVVAGERRTRQVISALLFLTVAAIPIPYVVLQYTGTYLLFGLMAAVALLSAATFVYSDKNRLHPASVRLKLAMVAGLVALAFSHIAE